MLLAPARFARDGVLEYTLPNGSKRKELRLPEENKKAIAEFGLLPLTVEHSHGLINEDNADDARKGITLQNVRYEVIQGKGGFVTGHIAVFDSRTKELLRSGEKCQLSHGYRCRMEETPGVWVNPVTGIAEKYDAIQRDIRGNHVAITAAGRAGSDCFADAKLDSLPPEDDDIAYCANIFDSQDYQSSKDERRMATLTIGNASYEAPEQVVAVVGPRLDRLDSLETKAEALQEDRDRLASRADDLETELANLQGHLDSTELVLGNAEEILTDLGYVRDNLGSYHLKADAKKTCDTCKKEMDSDDEEEEDVPDDEEAEGEMPAFMKGKKGKTKKDGGMYKKTDSLKDMVAAIKEADTLVPAVDGKTFSDLHLDSLESVSSVHQKVVEALAPKLFPNFKLDGKSADQIDLVYELIKDASDRQEAGERHDSSYSLEMRDRIAAARQGSTASKSPLDQAQANAAKESATAWEKPMAMSR